MNDVTHAAASWMNRADGAPGRPRLAGAMLLLVAALSLWLGGCSYDIEGTVVSGPTGEVKWVDSDDSRTEHNGIRDALVEITVDPESMHPKRLKPVYTDENGRFVVPMDEYGSSILEYQLSIVVRAEGYQAAVDQQKMPWFRGQMLVQMVPGADHYIKPGEDSLDESLKIKDRVYQRGQ